MPIHKLSLISKQEIAPATFIFTFTKPENFTFIPGQFGGFTLINPSEMDSKGATRRFSLLGSPNDSKLTIATRIQDSAYKRLLNALTPGSEIKFAGPSGNFILHTDINIPAVLIAGGIGVTPFYSMIKHAIEQNSKQHLHLFYGNQSSQTTALLKELNDLANQHPHFNITTTLSNPEENWQGETGFITDSMIKKYISDIHAPIYYVCGSPAMVESLKQTLLEMGIDTEKIKVEDFPGY